MLFSIAVAVREVEDMGTYVEADHRLEAADAVARRIAEAAIVDPRATEWLAYLLERVAESLTERPDTEYAAPRILVFLGLLLERTKDLEFASKVLEQVSSKLRNTTLAELNGEQVALDWALVEFVLVRIESSKGHHADALSRARNAWRRVRRGPVSDNWKWFIAQLYCVSLEHSRAIPRGTSDAMSERLRSLFVLVEGEPNHWICDLALWK